MITHTTSTTCLYCGQKYRISYTLNPDIDIDKALLSLRKYKAKCGEIILHKRECEKGYCGGKKGREKRKITKVGREKHNAGEGGVECFLTKEKKEGLLVIRLSHIPAY